MNIRVKLNLNPNLRHFIYRVKDKRTSHFSRMKQVFTATIRIFGFSKKYEVGSTIKNVKLEEWDATRRHNVGEDTGTCEIVEIKWKCTVEGREIEKNPKFIGSGEEGSVVFKREGFFPMKYEDSKVLGRISSVTHRYLVMLGKVTDVFLLFLIGFALKKIIEKSFF